MQPAPAPEVSLLRTFCLTMKKHSPLQPLKEQGQLISTGHTRAATIRPQHIACLGSQVPQVGITRCAVEAGRLQHPAPQQMQHTSPS